ncbi:MAG: hypothetical protein EXR72_18370 [Myxococcales bacterium]|nr:hypothetical protein [Myxococcales bacterium]
MAAIPARAEPVSLTIVSAKIDPKKVVKGGPARSTASLSDLTCLSYPGLRPIAASCGGAARAEGAPAIDPMALLSVGGTVIRTYPIPGTLAPEWNYTLVVEPDELDDTVAPSFALVDVVAGKEMKLGTKALKWKDLFAPGVHTLKGVAGQSEITWRVEVLPRAAAPRSYKVVVPADQQMADLARAAKEGDAPGKYLLVPVAKGEMVEVVATGKVQPSAKKRPEIVSGPNGIPTIQTKIQFNQPGFRGCPGCDHAALIAQLGNQAFVVGERKQFTAESAGMLLFGINDVKVADNAGATRCR